MKLKSSDILDLPNAKDSVSETPKMSVSEMFARCQKLLPIWNEKRFAKKSHTTMKEFSL